MEKRTLGREFAGRFRPSMFVTLTLRHLRPGARRRHAGRPGRATTTGGRLGTRCTSPRWWTGGGRTCAACVGWDVQYFATVEPQKRCAPHLHAAIRGSIPHEVLRQVTAATYHQVWWPAHDELVYDGDQLPVWDGRPVRRPGHPAAADHLG